MLLVWPLTAVLLAALSQAQDSVRGEEGTTLSRDWTVWRGWEYADSRIAWPGRNVSAIRPHYAQYHGLANILLSAYGHLCLPDADSVTDLLTYFCLQSPLLVWHWLTVTDLLTYFCLQSPLLVWKWLTVTDLLTYFCLQSPLLAWHWLTVIIIWYFCLRSPLLVWHWLSHRLANNTSAYGHPCLSELTLAVTDLLTSAYGHPCLSEMILTLSVTDFLRYFCLACHSLSWHLTLSLTC